MTIHLGGRGPGHMSRAEGKFAPPPALLTVPYRDDFSGAAGTIYQRAAPIGSPQVSWLPGADDSSTHDSLKLDGSGHLIGQQAGSWFYTTMELDTGISPDKWWRIEMSSLVASVAFAGTGPYFMVCHSVVTPGSHNCTRFNYFAGGGFFALGYSVDSASSSGGTELLHTNTDSAGLGLYPRPGDVMELRKYTSGSQVWLEPYYNGQQIGVSKQIDGLGVTLNDVLALKGTVPTTGEIDAIQVGSPTSHGMLSVYVARVPQLNADGSASIRVTGDYTGAAPTGLSVTAWSDTSVTVRFDKNGASALEVVNTVATLTDYRGGLTFATDSGFTAEKVPTAVSAPTDIDSTYAELTWTFAAGSFSTKPYVRGPYGANPFNRTGNTTVNGDIQNQGSMVRGVFTGEPQNIPVQPYYSAAGDYIAGS